MFSLKITTTKKEIKNDQPTSLCFLFFLGTEVIMKTCLYKMDVPPEQPASTGMRPTAIDGIFVNRMGEG